MRTFNRRTAQRIELIALGLLFILTATAGSAFAEAFIVGFHSGGFPPMFFEKGDAEKGIFVEVMEKISEITGDGFERVYAPAARVIRNFGTDYEVEPGIHPDWRVEQADISVYTVPFMTHTDCVVVRKDAGFAVAAPTDLEGKSVGVIRGFVYTGWTPEEGGYTPDPATDSVMLFRKLQGKRYDALFTGKYVAKYFAKTMNIEINIAKEIDSKDISFRFYKDKASAVPRINAAIEKLKADGVIDAIIRKYTE